MSRLPLLSLLLLACEVKDPKGSDTPADDTDDPTPDTDEDTTPADDTDAPAPGLPGKLDTTFGEGGIVRLSLEDGTDSAHGVAIAADDSVYVTARTWDDQGLHLLRFTPDGELDTSFAGDGVIELTTSAGAYFGLGPSLVLRDDGVAIVAWIEGTSVLVRAIGDNGQPVAGFGSSGTATFTAGSFGFVPVYLSVLTDADGAVFLTSGSSSLSVVLKLTSGGVADPGYGSGGKAAILDFFALTGDVDAQGRMLVAGSSQNARAIVRLLPDGSRDTDFDVDGLAILGTLGLISYYNHLLALPGGGFVAQVPILSSNLEVIEDDGTLRTTFGVDGMLGLAPDTVCVHEIDGALYATGGTNDLFVVYKLDRTTGDLVASFDDDGVAHFPVGTEGAESRQSALDSRGRLIIAGSSNDAGTDVVLVRLWL